MLVSKVTFSPMAQFSVLKNKNYNLQSFGVQKDTFEHSQAMTTDKKPENISYNKFISWAKGSQLLKKGMINPTPIEVTKDTTRYELIGTNEWVLSQSNSMQYIPGSHSKPVVTKVKEVLPDKNLGQTIARIEYPSDIANSKLYFVEKKQTGREINVPNGKYAPINPETEQKYKDQIKAVASMPQEAFNKLVGDILELNTLGYEFDSDTDNSILISDDSKEFIIRNPKRKDDNNYDVFTNTFITLLGGNFGIRYCRQQDIKDRKHAPKDSELRNNINRITINYSIAMRDNACCFNNNERLTKLLNTGVLDEVLAPPNAMCRYTELVESTVA